MPKALDLTDKKFGRLTTISFSHSNNHGKRCWNVKCDCGKDLVVVGGSLTSGNSKSCGCINMEGHIKHGMVNTPAYVSWYNMKTRCFNKNSHKYPRYGGRGIKVCDRWLGDMGFENFLADMGERPDGMTIDRKDNDGNYEPNNCRWATNEEQDRNRSNNIIIEHNGIRKTVVEWAEELRIDPQVIRTRLYNGWPEVKAITTIKGGSNG